MHNGRGPILVHCSAGIGRTGTFCCVHTIVQKLDQVCELLCCFGGSFLGLSVRTQDYNERPNETPTFNVFDTILRLRASRAGKWGLPRICGLCSSLTRFALRVFQEWFKPKTSSSFATRQCSRSTSHGLNNSRLRNNRGAHVKSRVLVFRCRDYVRAFLIRSQQPPC